MGSLTQLAWAAAGGLAAGEVAAGALAAGALAAEGLAAGAEAAWLPSAVGGVFPLPDSGLSTSGMAGKATGSGWRLSHPPKQIAEATRTPRKRPNSLGCGSPSRSSFRSGAACGGVFSGDIVTVLRKLDRGSGTVLSIYENDYSGARRPKPDGCIGRSDSTSPSAVGMTRQSHFPVLKCG